MESFFSRYRNALVLIVVLVAQLLALAIQAKRPTADGADRHSVSLARYAVVTIITPPERLVRNTGLWFRSVWFGYIDLIHVRRENAGLRQEVERLRLEQASIAQDADQGRRLQHMLGFAERYANKTLAAQVIGTGGTDQSQVVYIDKGSAEGLQQDMPVITAEGIVGKVKDVFPHTSQVLLVTDPTSGVGVILEATRIRGILKGRANDQLQVADVSPDGRVKAGEQIVTSGGDQIFPRGLPVGSVDRVVADPERDPLVNVLVHPAAKLSQLEEVLVITDLSDVISPQESKDIAESRAEGEAAQKRASDVLSERLPSRIDPNAPADTNPEDLVDAAGNALRKLPPPKPDHPDAFSPNAEPSAAQMVPGQRWAAVKDGTEDAKPASRPRSTQPIPSTSAPTYGSGSAAGNVSSSPASTAGSASTGLATPPKNHSATPNAPSGPPSGGGAVAGGPESKSQEKEPAQPITAPAKPENGAQPVTPEPTTPPPDTPKDNPQSNPPASTSPPAVNHSGGLI
jgi:rod shape-determining protein MreC